MIARCFCGQTVLLLWTCTLLILSLCAQGQAKRRAATRGSVTRAFGGRPSAGAPPMQSRGYGGGYGAGAPPVHSQGYGGGYGAGAPPVHSQGYGGGYGAGAPPVHSQGYVGGYGAGAPQVHSQGSSNSGLKIAGAAAAGALGGAILGHGLSSLAQPGYGGYGGYGGFGGYGGYGGHGSYNGYGRYGGYGSGYFSQDTVEDTRLHNETDTDFYFGDASSSHSASSFIVLGSLLSYLLGCFVTGF